LGLDKKHKKKVQENISWNIAVQLKLFYERGWEYYDKNGWELLFEVYVKHDRAQFVRTLSPTTLRKAYLCKTEL
jgi:hypothetical protein